MKNLNRSPRLPQLLKRQLAAEPLTLIDVGCSGGIDPVWDIFGLHIQAIGFDPLVAEIERLRAQERRPGFRYEAAHVGCPDFERLFPKALREDRVKSQSNWTFHRTSAHRAMQAMGYDYHREVFNSGAEVKLADRHVDLDSYLAAHGIAAVDFIKIDTDGHDLEVLLGARATLAERGVLGVEIECQFHGPVHPYANVFCNVDRLMREAGFALVDLDVWRYTRGALPGAFYYDLVGQTAGGAVEWADALYMRDLADPAYAEKTGFSPTPGQLAKAACLYEIFAKSDCAAELIVNRRAAFEPIAELLLDTLTPIKGGAGVYRQYLALFDADPKRFYPSSLRRRQAS